MCPSCASTSAHRISIAALTASSPTLVQQPIVPHPVPQLQGAVAKGRRGKHVCEFPSCGRAFTRKSNMQAHKRKHLPASDVNAHPFSCTQSGCNRKFKWRSSLKSHQGTCSHLILEAARQQNTAALEPARSSTSTVAGDPSTPRPGPGGPMESRMLATLHLAPPTKGLPELKFVTSPLSLPPVRTYQHGNVCR
jgi:hypothetical protein